MTLLPILLASALAADPAPTDGPSDRAADPVPESVAAIEGVTAYAAFRLPEAQPYRMRGDHPAFDRGLILQLEVEPGFARARQIDQPVLYVGTFPARRVNPSESGRCLVVWAPLDGPVDQTIAFYGSRMLPERVDAERGAAERDAALAAGATPLLPKVHLGADLLSDLDAVWSAAQAMAESCPTPE